MRLFPRLFVKPVSTGISMLAAAVLGHATFAAVAEEQPALNPLFFYYFGGETLGDRSFTLGDPSDWSTPLANMSGVSAGHKLEVRPTSFMASGDAIHGIWSKKEVKGELALVGPPIDLSAVGDLAALTFNIRIDRKPTADVWLAMDCGYPCRAEANITEPLLQQPNSQWFSLPVPLDCFTSNDFDLTRIKGVFLLSTAGAMEVSIADIRLERLPEGEKGCVD